MSYAIKSQWYISLGLLCQKLLKQYYNDSYAGHFGYKCILKLIEQKFYWLLMAKDIQEYVESCVTCRQVKPTQHLPYRELQSLPFLMGPRQNWTMDFIMGLPPSLQRGSEFNAILVVVNRFTKYSIYLFAQKDWNVNMLVDVFVEVVFTKYSMLVSFMNDRGSLFTSHFWSHFCYYLKIRLGYSTAFHPQTDSQMERQNQTLEQYLQSYINY